MNNTMNSLSTLIPEYKKAVSNIDEIQISWVLEEPKHESVDIEKELINSIENSIGIHSLWDDLNERKPKNILVMIDDNTRATPQWIILPIILNKLEEYGYRKDKISIVVCLGTHRPLSQSELKERVSGDVYEKYEVFNLDQSENAFESYGKTENGTPIFLSKIVKEYDYKIAVGNIIPHMYAGWSGGAKMVQPGITSAETTAKTHLLAASMIDKILGNPENPVREEMEKIARIAGLNYIINTVISNDGKILGFFSGDIVLAHREAVRFADPIFSRTIPQKASVVISGAYPASRDLWQGFKPLNNAGRAVKDKGVLILVISAPEGIAPDHQELVCFGKKTREEVRLLTDEGKVCDNTASATYQAFAASRERFNIILVSDGISDEEAKKIGIRSVKTIEEALVIAKTFCNLDDIGIIPYGADVIIRERIK